MNRRAVARSRWIRGVTRRMVRRGQARDRAVRTMMRRDRTIRRYRTFHRTRTNHASRGRPTTEPVGGTAHAELVERVMLAYERMMQLLVLEDAPDFGDVGITMAQAKVLHVLAGGPMHMSEPRRPAASHAVDDERARREARRAGSRRSCRRSGGPPPGHRLRHAGRPRTHGAVPRAERPPAPRPALDRRPHPTSRSSSGPSRSCAMPRPAGGRMPRASRPTTQVPATTTSAQGSHQ